MKKFSRLTILTLAILSTFTYQGCKLELNGTDTIPSPSSTTVKNKAPVIAAFDYSPKSGVSKEDFITFTVVANDPEGEALQYNWTSTKGSLTSNSGSAVAWRPLKADGSFEPGLSNIILIVSDGAMTTTATANIMISSEGKATIQNTEITQTPGTTNGTLIPSIQPTVIPTLIPTVIPTVKPTITPTPVPTATTSTEIKIFDNGNIAGVSNNPTSSTTFTLTKSFVITKVMTYHWNNGQGTTITGTHSFESTSGRAYGPYSTTGSPGQGNVTNAYWNSTPNVTLPEGTYTIIDSDSSTWSQNSGSQGKGMTIIYGYPADSSVPVVTPTIIPDTDNSNATGVLKTGGSTLPYYQLDFKTRYNHKREIGIIKAEGVPISGFKDESAYMALLSLGQIPGGEAYPPKFYWDVNNFKTKFVLLTNFLAWWGEKYSGEQFATLTVEGTNGEKEIFDLVIGKHVAEWNGGSITENPPSVTIVGSPSGSPESRVFVDRFDLKQITQVKRITVELNKAPMWSSTEYAAWFIDGITLVGEWQI